MLCLDTEMLPEVTLKAVLSNAKPRSLISYECNFYIRFIALLKTFPYIDYNW